MRGRADERQYPMIHRIAQSVVALIILAVGAMGAMAFVNMRTPPKQKAVEEQMLRVEVIEVHPQNVPVSIKGFGEAKARDIVHIIPEVAGNVVEIHPRLEVGEVVPAGELLFKIDPRNYQSLYDQALAQAQRAEQGVKLLEGQFRTDAERLKNAERSAELADREFSRLKTLFENEQVGTLANVERAELSMNQTADMRDQMSQAVTLYPVRIQEARSALEAARAQVDLAKANLDRCEVRAPFAARLTLVRVEQGQYVAPAGQAVLSLADDSVIELSVPLDSRDVSAWLRFETGQLENGNAWFGALEQVPCTVQWTEGSGNVWEAVLNRVEAFDPRSRTVTVNVRVTATQASTSSGGLPLVDGMFCAVTIPGHEMKDVYQLPDWAVDFNGFAYLAKGDRLEKRSVSVVRGQDGHVFVDHGLSPGDRVIVTRLVNPLPDSLLQITLLNPDGTPKDATPPPRTEAGAASEESAS